MSEEKDRRSEILDAAFEEFAAKGYKGATIKSIAREAGLQSPALIYWYFPDKEALFREVLGSQAPILRTVSDPASLMDLPPEEALPKLGRAFLSFDRTNTKMARLVIGEATRQPEIGEVFFKSGPFRVLGFLKAYLERQVEVGRLRPHDVRSSSRAFIGMLAPQVAAKVFLPSLLEDGLGDEEHLQTAVGIFLGGLESES